MKKHIACHKCGKELEHSNAYFMDDKPLCVDCFHPLVCKKCGKAILHDDPVSRIKAGAYCRECLFSNNECDAFIFEYHNYQRNIDALRKKALIKIILILLIQLFVLAIGNVIFFHIYNELEFGFYAGILSSSQLFVVGFIVFIVWIVITVMLVKRIQSPEIMSISEFYERKYGNSSVQEIFQNRNNIPIADSLFPNVTPDKRMRKIYEKMKTKKLSDREIDLAVYDFIAHAKQHTVVKQQEYCFSFRNRQVSAVLYNGILVCSPRDKKIFIFKVNQENGSRMNYTLAPNMAVYFIGCDIQPMKTNVKYSLEEQAAQTATQHQHISQQDNAISQKIEKIEKINHMKEQGMLTQEEFEQLKNELLKTEPEK